MLVLTRRLGEEIIIAGNIRIKIIEAHGDRARIGITAPKSVRVDRAEVHERRDAADAPTFENRISEYIQPALTY